MMPYNNNNNNNTAIVHLGVVAIQKCISEVHFQIIKLMTITVTIVKNALVINI